MLDGLRRSLARTVNEFTRELRTVNCELRTVEIPPMPPDTLTARELAIMKVVWDTPGATVRDVHAVLSRTRPTAYTTVMTLMNILEHKGYLTRRKVDRAYVYRATRPRKQVLRALVRDFVDRVFDGVAQPLRVHLVKEQPISAEERRELQRLIDTLEE